MPARPIPLTRRAFVTGGLAGAALALTGCDAVEGVFDGDDDPGVSGSVTPTAPPVDADSDLVATVRDAVTATGALATAIGTAVPALAARATRLARLHEEHAAELGGAEPAEAPVVPRGEAAALRRLLREEGRLQDQLVEAAGRAESGALAQVLAAMAAAVAQQRGGAPVAPRAASAGDSGDPGDQATEALQTTLAAEHAAVFVYAALGAQTSRSADPGLFGRVTAAYRLHRTRRDELMALLEAAGADPVAAEPGYALPPDLGSARAVTTRARRLEADAASTYAYLVASSTGEIRAWAVAALLDAAVRGLGFGGRPESFPGL